MTKAFLLVIIRLKVFFTRILHLDGRHLTSRHESGSGSTKHNQSGRRRRIKISVIL
jgi:hypothetical protein